MREGFQVPTLAVFICHFVFWWSPCPDSWIWTSQEAENALQTICDQSHDSRARGMRTGTMAKLRLYWTWKLTPNPKPQDCAFSQQSANNSLWAKDLPHVFVQARTIYSFTQLKKIKIIQQLAKVCLQLWLCKTQGFSLVLFINHYSIYLYFNCKHTFAHPCISLYVKTVKGSTFSVHK